MKLLSRPTKNTTRNISEIKNIIFFFNYINFYVFSTYGHSLNDNDVIFHEYFGTDRVINDLKSFEGYIDGVVELCEDSFVRDDNTNQVVAIKR